MKHRDDIPPDVYADAIGDEDFFVGRHPRRAWSPGAVYCHLSGTDCQHCYNHHFYRMNVDKDCLMPDAVSELLSRNKKIPQPMINRYEFYRFSGTLELRSRREV